jgi:hypothetical protein
MGLKPDFLLPNEPRPKGRGNIINSLNYKIGSQNHDMVLTILIIAQTFKSGQNKSNIMWL